MLGQLLMCVFARPRSTKTISQCVQWKAWSLNIRECTPSMCLSRSFSFLQLNVQFPSVSYIHDGTLMVIFSGFGIFFLSNPSNSFSLQKKYLTPSTFCFPPTVQFPESIPSKRLVFVTLKGSKQSLCTFSGLQGREIFSEIWNFFILVQLGHLLLTTDSDYVNRSLEWFSSTRMKTTNILKVYLVQLTIMVRNYHIQDNIDFIYSIVRLYYQVFCYEKAS